MPESCWRVVAETVPAVTSPDAVAALWSVSVPVPRSKPETVKFEPLSVTLPAVPETVPRVFPACESDTDWVLVSSARTVPEAVIVPPVCEAEPLICRFPLATTEPPVCSSDPITRPDTPLSVPETVALPSTRAASSVPPTVASPVTRPVAVPAVCVMEPKAVVAVADAFPPFWTSVVMFAAWAEVPAAAAVVCSSEAIVPEITAVPPDWVSLPVMSAALTVPPDCVKSPETVPPVASTVPAVVAPSANSIVPALSVPDPASPENVIVPFPTLNVAPEPIPPVSTIVPPSAPTDVPM